MKGCALNHSAYRAGLLALAALCLEACIAGISGGAGLDHAAMPDQAKRQIAYADIPAGLRVWLEKEGIGVNNFSDHIAAISRLTAERERQGEYDHLIFFLLQ